MEVVDSKSTLFDRTKAETILQLVYRPKLGMDLPDFLSPDFPSKALYFQF